MSTLDKLIERATGLRRADEWGQPVLDVVLKDETTGKIETLGFATQEQYVLELRATSLYWANKAQRSDARKQAEAIITHLLYEDALMPLQMLRQAILNGDREAAYKWCNELESAMVKP